MTTSSVATVVLYVAIRCTSDGGCVSDELSSHFLSKPLLYTGHPGLGDPTENSGDSEGNAEERATICASWDSTEAMFSRSTDERV